ncbi:CPCC family cysteine-rich protein [Paenibacillus sp. PAMC21692]|uniref:CPCC family cysteine-rich protein n=1 Tax=Paenibacillus sp. PAMC21692 TaxID=2762320 RepID=UPI00164E9779|nr:CPCC family cysteine-rich protein [Paenibacillus sp. PAMC21692]QNK54691.1 glycosyltransferase [Paenibacillus sp. PAMC21692]
MKRQQCPCCDFYTVDSEDEVIVDICDVCFWQYDLIAHELPDKNIGANHISLNQARENYKLFDVCKQEFRHLVRDPIEEELPENNIG